MTIGITLQEHAAQQEAFMRKKVHEQAQSLDAIFTNEFYSMMETESEFDDDPVFRSQDEKTYRSMLRQYISQESTKNGRGHFTKELEKCLLRLQFDQQEA